MSPWMAGAALLLLAFVPLLIMVLRSGRFDRLVALQLATINSVLLLLVLAEAFDRPSYSDMAITLALLAFPGTLAFAVTLERWL